MNGVLLFHFAPKQLYQIVFLNMNDYRKGDVGLFLITFPTRNSELPNPLFSNFGDQNKAKSHF